MAISGTLVALTSRQTGIRLVTRSNETGYRFNAVDLGLYDLIAALTGFQTYSGVEIAVLANRVATIDPELSR